MKAVNNHYPCCGKRTGLHFALYTEGDIIMRQCGRCARFWQITFQASRVVPDCFHLKFDVVVKL